MAKHENIDVEIHYTVHIPAEHVEKMLQCAREEGHNYNDARTGELPGPIELLRRLIMDSGTSNYEMTIEDPANARYTRHK